MQVVQYDILAIAEVQQMRLSDYLTASWPQMRQRKEGRKDVAMHL